MGDTKESKRALPVNAALDVEKQKEFNQKVQRIRGKHGPITPGVVYVAHIPWGFEEKGLKGFFSQFGTIEKLRLSRSKKTANSKGFAFIQFAHDAVAKIVADTMDNYLMFGKLLKCKYMENPHPKLFKGLDRPITKPLGQERAISRHNRPKDPEKVSRNAHRAFTKYKKKISKLAEAGIEYKLENVEEQLPEKVKQVTKSKRKTDKTSKTKSSGDSEGEEMITEPAQPAQNSPKGRKQAKTPKRKTNETVKETSTKKIKPSSETQDSKELGGKKTKIPAVKKGPSPKAKTAPKKGLKTTKSPVRKSTRKTK